MVEHLLKKFQTSFQQLFFYSLVDCQLYYFYRKIRINDGFMFMINWKKILKLFGVTL